MKLRWACSGIRMCHSYRQSTLVRHSSFVSCYTLESFAQARVLFSHAHHWAALAPSEVRTDHFSDITEMIEQGPELSRTHHQQSFSRSQRLPGMAALSCSRARQHPAGATRGQESS